VHLRGRLWGPTPSRFTPPGVALIKALTDLRRGCPNDGVPRSVAAIVRRTRALDGFPTPGPEAAPCSLEPIAQHPPARLGGSLCLGMRNGKPVGGADAFLSARMQRYRSNIAKFGRPNPMGREWPAFTVARPQVLSLMQPLHVAADFSERHNCAFLRENKLLAAD
jgi:hypothetical protein